MHHPYIGGTSSAHLLVYLFLYILAERAGAQDRTRAPYDLPDINNNATMRDNSRIA
jgi:hypothetical protein